jgi:hypothetical protein
MVMKTSDARRRQSYAERRIDLLQFQRKRMDTFSGTRQKNFSNIVGVKWREIVHKSFGMMQENECVKRQKSSTLTDKLPRVSISIYANNLHMGKLKIWKINGRRAVYVLRCRCTQRSRSKPPINPHLRPQSSRISTNKQETPQESL